ncbi:MAG TPA: 3-hydroxylacyl-ACP dehydratase [Casimicrobiaceae bacterium]|nr:3-hydroxylacyl-ACP dehydratase [Casimicrobiaceae bacterium]
MNEAHHVAIADLIPQSGAMVLLDRVVAHDQRTIVCRADSHRDPANPLVDDGKLPIWAGIEYAAQAMAAHFSLTSGTEGRATTGLLGGLRDVHCEVMRLDDVEGELVIEAERLSNDRLGSIYRFRVASSMGCTLIRGRATVVQQVATA